MLTWDTRHIECENMHRESTIINSSHHTYNCVWLLLCCEFPWGALWEYTGNVTSQEACGEAEISVISWSVRGEIKGRENKRKGAGLNQRWIDVEQMLIWSISFQVSSKSSTVLHYYTTISLHVLLIQTSVYFPDIRQNCQLCFHLSVWDCLHSNWFPWGRGIHH